MAFGVDARIAVGSVAGVSASSEEGLADSMTLGAASETGPTFAGKGGLLMNVLLDREVAVHGFEHGPGEGSGLGWRAFSRGARGMSGTGASPVIVRGVGMGGRCGIGNRAVGARAAAGEVVSPSGGLG
jgi:hypothetical protein